jgi:signal transduction histidine kinase/FixJ family two-component response regulator/putative methionine-R-sulfoxide reductase with GAF domain
MSGELILVVDDSKEIIRHLTERLLPTYGFKSIHAVNGREGLKLIRQEKPDLVMIDLNLPEMTGLDVLQNLAYESIEIPTVLMTGYGSEKSAIEAFRLGVRDYLIKPFTVDEVLETINRALMEKRLRQDKQQLTGELQRSNVEIRRRLSEMNNIIGIGKSINGLRSIDAVVERVLESTTYVTNAEECVLWLLNPQTNQLETYSKLTDNPTPPPSLDISTSHPLISQVIRDGRILREASFSGTGINVKAGYNARALLYVPLILRGATTGVLGVHNRSAPRAFSERDEEMLTILADFAAIALDNARAFAGKSVATAPDTNSSNVVLNKLNRAIASTLSVDEMMRFAIRQVHAAWDIEASSIWLLNEGRGSLRVLASMGSKLNALQGIEVPLSEGLVGHAARTGKWIYTNHAKSHQAHFKNADEQTGFETRSLLCTPLIFRKKVIGVLQLVNKLDGDFDEKDVERTLEFATSVAIALANALLRKQADSRQYQLETIFKATPFPMIMADNEGMLVQLNNHACRQLHLSSSMVGQPVSQVLKPENLYRFFGQPLRKGQVKESEFEFPDGTLWVGQIAGIPHSGRVLHLQNITNLKQADQSKSDFLATVSHDLRSPLHSVSGFAQALGDLGGLNPKQLIYLEQIKEATGRMSDLVNDLLDLARVTTGFEQTRVPCQLGDIITEVVQEVQGQAWQKQVTLDVSVVESLPTVLGDPYQLRQAIGNLVENGVKYTNAGTSVHIQALPSADTVRLMVTDHGGGIPLKEQEKIFDRFYRGPSQRNTQGTGLGLALVRSIADAHGGQVQVESQENAGTTFILALPTVTKVSEKPEIAIDC